MFPPWALVPIGAAQFLSLYFGLQALSGFASMRLSAHGVLAAISTVLWMFLVRVQDDLADIHHDIRLGHEGDPRYRGRPIVTGDITPPELRGMYRIGVLLLFALNAAFGVSLGFVACAIGFGVTWMGFRWFFIARIAAHPTPLAYLARKSLTLLLGLYALAVFVDDFGAPANPGLMILLLCAPTAGVAAWEVARKIRIPEDETSYDTYSKVLGWRNAALLPVIFVTVSVVCLTPVAWVTGVDKSFLLVLSGVGALTIGACLRFRMSPTRRNARLEPFAQLYGLVAHGGLAVTLPITHGLLVP